MRRRICLAVGLVALSVPASGWAQSSSQAQYQGVAPETQIPVTGNGGGGSTGGGAGALTGGSTQTGGSNSATGAGRPVSGGSGSSGAAGNGGPSATAQRKVALPDASSSTAPISGGDFVWILLAIAALTGLGLLLRRTTRRSPAM